ncbi:MAG: glycoside-pentoside-hexuronide (GPH):cation symporter [Liquorilactobacillus ghanensis]|uniref:glycoside-pentoside-hexuronide (GPH):cation symporter n=1 Tax=Liquorilactobacillus ghanensis TaxID=399370 RepID=UPI0039EA8CA0
MENKQKLTKKSLISRTAFALGNLGHSAFYGALSTYFIVFVTSSMFSGLDKNIADKLIGLITSLIVFIRIAEIVIDPLIGNVVDNTHTKWGKFKPWIIIGNVVSSVLLIIIFTGIFGLAKVNWILFAVVFVILFITLDVFYSFSDVAYWGMVPALSEDSHERGIYTSLGSFTGTIGWNGLTVIIVPIVTYFTFLATGKHYEGAPGWLAFAVIISIIALVCAFAVALGTNEKDNLIRKSAKQKTTIKDVFKALAHNDQLLWTSLAYFLYSFAYVVTNGVLFYLFKFVVGKPNEYWIVGVIATIIGFCTSPIYPILNKFIPRKWLFASGQFFMILAYLIFILGRDNMLMLTIGLVLFDINFAQLVTVLTLTDSIEYGQLKNGERNEAVVLAVRPMIDKLTGAFSNGLVGFIAIAAGMTGKATAADMTPKDIHTFESMAFYVPLVLAILSLIAFLAKVKLTEKKHATIVEELNNKLISGQISLDTDDTSNSIPVSKDSIMLTAPVDGELINLNELPTKFPGTGFAIKPASGKVYAPFDGTIKFTFTTKHVIGIESENGIGAIIHIGIDTVNIHGEEFTTHYLDGQKVKSGDLLLDFNRDLIINNGYDDTVIIFFTQPKLLRELPSFKTDTFVHHKDKLGKITLK